MVWRGVNIHRQRRYSTRHDHTLPDLVALPRRHPRHRSLPRHRGSLVRRAAGRPGRGRREGGGHRAGRRVAHLAAPQGRRGRRVPALQPEQARHRARSEDAGGGGGGQAAGEGRGRGHRELPHRHHGVVRARLRRAVADQPAAHLLLGLRVRPHRAAQGQPGLRGADAGLQRHHVHHRRAGRPAGAGGRLVPRPDHRHPVRARRLQRDHPAAAHRPGPARGRLAARDRGEPARLPRRGLPAHRRAAARARLGSPVALALSQLQVPRRAVDLHRGGQRSLLAEARQGARARATWPPTRAS